MIILSYGFHSNIINIVLHYCIMLYIIALEIIFVDVAIFVVCLLNKQLL